MKTAISLPDTLFNSAEKTAKKLGISRSKLFARAIEEFLENFNHTSITKKLDAVYSIEDSKLDDKLNEMQTKSFSVENY